MTTIVYLVYSSILFFCVFFPQNTVSFNMLNFNFCLAYFHVLEEQVPQPFLSSLRSLQSFSNRCYYDMETMCKGTQNRYEFNGETNSTDK